MKNKIIKEKIQNESLANNSEYSQKIKKIPSIKSRKITHRSNYYHLKNKKSKLGNYKPMISLKNTD